MSRIITIFLIIGLISCKNKIDKTNLTDLAVFAENVKFEFPDSIENKRDLIGKWIEKSIWIQYDSGWKGLKSINITHRFEFFENFVYHRTELYNDSIIKWTEKGEFNLYADTLYLFTNNKGDTVFHQGDTMRAEKKIIYELNESNLKVQEYYFDYTKKRTFYEYVKIK